MYVLCMCTLPQKSLHTFVSTLSKKTLNLDGVERVGLVGSTIYLATKIGLQKNWDAQYFSK